MEPTKQVNIPKGKETRAEAVKQFMAKAEFDPAALGDVQRVIDEIVAPLVTKIAEVRESRYLTAEGRVKTIDEIATPARENIARLERDHLASYDARVESLTAEALRRPPTRPEDAVGRLLIEREIRDRLHDLHGTDPLAIAPLYFAAIQRGDETFIRAVEDAPQAFPLLRKDDRETGRLLRLQATPQYAQVEALRNDQNLWRDFYAAVRADITAAVTDSDRRL